METRKTDMMKSELSPARRRLVEKMQGLNHGRIEWVAVRGGEPVLEPATRVVREFRTGKTNGPRPEAARADFALKAEVIEFFDWLDSVGDGVIERIDVRDGLPCGMAFREVAA